MRIEERVQKAAQAYASGCNCAQAVFCAYAGDMGISEETACRIMEGFGGGIGGLQEICGALTGAIAVVSHAYSSGVIGKNPDRKLVYEKAKQAVELFQAEYGAIACRVVLRGNGPKASKCSLKVEDAVRIAEKLVEGVPCRHPEEKEEE